MKSRFQNGTRVGLQSKAPDLIDQTGGSTLPSHFQSVKRPRLGLNPGFPRPSKPVGLERALYDASEKKS